MHTKLYQIKRSSIHGRGLFASQKLKPGCIIGIYEGKSTSRNGPYVLWVTTDDGIEQGISGKNSLRFVNHSTKPNCIFYDAELHVLHPIQSGDELTCHYGDEWD